MFARVKKGRKAEYLQIVENYRDGGKVRQRLVLYVGHYNSIDDALHRMPRELRNWRTRRTIIADDEFTGGEVEHLNDLIKATDERLQALRALAKEHPEVVERDRKRAARRPGQVAARSRARRAQRERERRESAERSDQQRELREKVREPGLEVGMLRKRRNRLRAAARRRFRRVEDAPVPAHREGIALTDDDWRKIEEILEEAEHLSEEADKLTAELKRRQEILEEATAELKRHR
jgi:chromosome segregation ATPase